jgi:single-stranded-DNA-specific exonuclease
LRYNLKRNGNLKLRLVINLSKQWMLKQSGVNTVELAKAAGVPELTVALLANRGIKDVDEVKKFMKASLEDLHEGILMKDMIKGTTIIAEGIKQGKSIVVYGDYDVDGVVSTYILYSALKECGAKVSYYIPDRESEGYGMNSQRIETLSVEQCDIILTCDNGIAAKEQISLAKKLGMQVVVTDHHDVPFTEDEKGERSYVVPEADAIINPKQMDCSYPFKYLCGGGIAFKFSEELFKLMGRDKRECLKYVEYAAIATICDVVDLIGENRIIAKNGLEMINRTKNTGLKALIKQTNLEGKKIGTYHIGFIIGPCINATGRLENAKLSVELLLSEEVQNAEQLAKRLHELNIERQELTSRSVEDIIEYIEKNKMGKDKVLVVYNNFVHESIAGIVAGRIKERYNVPTIILTEGKEMPKGSGRSIDNYNMFEELLKCKELLHKFGGHPMAAGLSLEEKNIPELRERLLSNCSLTEEDLTPKIRIDRKLSLNAISYKLIEELEKLEPFGKGNPAPLFAEKEVEVIRAYLIGKDKNILKLSCRIKDSFTKIDAISFDNGEEFKNIIIENYGSERLEQILNNSPAGLKLDLIFYPGINEYNGNVSLQLQVKDIRLNKI